MIKRNIIKSFQVILILFASLFFTMCSPPSLDDIIIITPTISPEPTPSLTPEIDISEDETQSDLIFLGYDSLYNYVTSSQYNYIMLSTQDYFNSLYQSNIRNYAFSKYKNMYSSLLNEKFMFSNDEETKAPFIVFNEVYDKYDISDAKYKFILDEETLSTDAINYMYTVDLYVGSEKAASFAFIVNKKTLQIKIK